MLYNVDLFRSEKILFLGAHFCYLNKFKSPALAAFWSSCQQLYSKKYRFSRLSQLHIRRSCENRNKKFTAFRHSQKHYKRLCIAPLFLGTNFPTVSLNDCGGTLKVKLEGYDEKVIVLQMQNQNIKK